MYKQQNTNRETLIRLLVEQVLMSEVPVGGLTPEITTEKLFLFFVPPLSQ